MTSFPTPPEPEPKKPGLAALLNKLSLQLNKLVVDEIALAKLRLNGMVKNFGVGGALLAVAGVLALYGLGILIWSMVYGLATALPMWLATLLSALIIFAIAALAAVIGLARIKVAQKNTPAPQLGIKEGVGAIKRGLGKSETPAIQDDAAPAKEEQQ